MAVWFVQEARESSAAVFESLGFVRDAWKMWHEPEFFLTSSYHFDVTSRWVEYNQQDDDKQINNY